MRHSARWRVERAGTPGHYFSGWFAVLTLADGCVARTAHVPTWQQAMDAVAVHQSDELAYARLGVHA